jgi:Protein of unknown function (DUF3987)
MAKLPKQSRSSVRVKFFELLFEDKEGLLCIATTHPEAPKATFKQSFWEWPTDIINVENFIQKMEKDHNVYFCVNLLNRRERKKDFCLPGNLLWADLDDVNPMSLKIPPPIVIQSSLGRYQSLWRLTTELPPYQQEAYSRRIAYSLNGVDKSGWDLTQLLRVPFTVNFKYEPHYDIQLITALEHKAPPLLFDGLPVLSDVPELELPLELPAVDAVIYKHSIALKDTQFSTVYTRELEESEDWSKELWHLLRILFEAGMSPEEAYVVANASPCNKYARDMRPAQHLWQEVLRAQARTDSLMLIMHDSERLTMPRLTDLEEPIGRPFIQTYHEWATEATDAVPIFHDLSCTILLSAIVAGSVRLETSFGQIVPNLWGLILGDSTTTRKTTAMRMAVDMLNKLDPFMVMATDGSPEGLLTGLSERPNKVSIFHKDEVSGFFDSINKKDYLAGMPETLTQLYDVPPTYTRLLRKSKVTIEQSAFIFFCGGIPERVYDNLSEEYVFSGFLPRFLVVSGDAEINKLRPMGPPTESGEGKKSVIFSTLADLYEAYSVERPIIIGGQPVEMAPRVKAELTQKAWAEYNRIESLLTKNADESSIPGLALPTFERISRSLLKMALVLAAARQTPKKGKITVSDNDIKNAAFYIQDWGRYSVDMITNAGKKTSEKLLDKIVKTIREKPGIPRADLTRRHHLSKREADEVVATLEDRMLIRLEKHGKATRYYIL